MAAIATYGRFSIESRPAYNTTGDVSCFFIAAELVKVLWSTPR